MKTILFIVAFLSCININVISQDCKAYVPYKEGTKAEVTSYDKKNKVTGITESELKNVEESGDATSFTIHFKGYDDKNKLLHEGDFRYKCENGEFTIDMNSFLSEEQMKAYKDMDITITSEDINIPANCKAGDVLKDGFIKVHVVSNSSPINMDFVITIQNRKVEGMESITTKAGSFDCVKISQDVVTKSIMSFSVQTVDWYAEGVGSVKSESYRNGKLMGYTELTRFEKP